MINTRIVNYHDGSSQIIRILDDHVWKRWKRENPLAFEKSIVWLQPITGLDFVRVGVVRNATSRRGPLRGDGSGLVLGYSKLTSDAPRDPTTNAYVRRLFYLRAEDANLNMNQFPPDAIDPKSILPGVLGKPPDISELERGYPHYLCRAELGLSTPATVSPVSTH